MGLRALTIILAVASLASGCTENELGEMGCWPSPNLCRVVCTSAEACALEQNVDIFLTTTTEPTIRAGELVGGCDETILENTDFDNFGDADCLSTCKLQDGKQDGQQRCRFWRYDREEDKKTCTLMADDQCTDYFECVEGTHSEYKCKSGDLKCPDEGDHPVAPGKPCKAPIAFVSDYVHWGCIGEEGPLSAYNPNIVSLPPGTTCTTSARCADWEAAADTADLYRKLQVKCDGDTGKWAFQPNTGGDLDDYQVVLGKPEQGEDFNTVEPGVDGTEAILEPACTGGGVKLEVPVANIQAAGVELVCDTQVLPDGGLYTIKAPNTCLLLCDHHLGMTIGSVLDKETGEVVFKNDNGDPIADPTTVKCWDL